MVAGNSLQNLSLYDFLTDFIPGATLLLYLYLIIPIEDLVTVEQTSILLFGFFVAAFVLGHMLQWLREVIESESNTFAATMDNVRAENGDIDPSDVDENSTLEITPVHHDFLEKTNEVFELEDGFSDRERFRLVETYLETRPYQRTFRFRRLLSFYRSMFVATIIGLLAALLGLAGNLCGVGPFRGYSILLPLLAISVLLLISFYNRRSEFEEAYVSYAIREFYLDQILQEE